MKKLLLTFSLFIFTSLYSVSHTLVDTNKVWTERDNFGGPRIYLFRGDTVINTENYKKLYYSIDSTFSHLFYNCALREDTSGHVYVFDSNGERMLYDFSLNVGDNFHPSWIPTPMTVVSIDTITLLNGELRRRLFMSNFEYWIDGIGSTFGLLNVDFYEFVFDVNVDLNCFIENDTIKYNGLPNISCFQITTNIDDLLSDKSFTIFPNPFENFTNMELADPVNNAHLKIYKCDGSLVKSTNNLSGNKIKIERENMKSGIYFFSMTDKNNIVRGKFIVE